MAIRWDEFPHSEIRLKIYARLGQNEAAHSADDSLRHILRRRLDMHDDEDHRRFIELEARDIVEHLRSTRDVYHEFVEGQNCRPTHEAHWVVLRFAVFPTAIAVLQTRLVNYLKLSRVLARDLTLLFGIPTHIFARSSTTDETLLQMLSGWGLGGGSPDFEDKTPATDNELVDLARLINADTLLWFRDVGEGGAVGRPLGGGPFATDDRRSIESSWAICGLPTQFTLLEWMGIREKLWHQSSPWTDGLVNLFGCVQEELFSQWRAIPMDSLVCDWEQLALGEQGAKFKEILVPAEMRLPLRLQRGKECEELAKEITAIRQKRIRSGLTVDEIQAECSSFKIWKRVDVLSSEDKEVFLHPGRWEPGYANLLLGKLYADTHRDVAPGTVNTWRKDYRAYLRWQAKHPLKTAEDFSRELLQIKRSYRKQAHTK